MSDTKILEVFKEQKCLVRKDIQILSDQYRKIPRYVSDYLISELVDPNNIQVGLEKVQRLINEHFFDSEYKEYIKDKIIKHRKYSIIGLMQVTFDQGNNCYWTYIPSLEDRKVRINKQIVDQYGDDLLLSGLWGRIEIAYEPNVKVKNKHYPFKVIDFKPLQITNIDLDFWINSRNMFSTKEWLDLIINTLGLDPDKISQKEKMLHVCRLLPFVEPGIHMMELGPPETAKTHMFRNLSPLSYVIAGSQTTVASLFYNKLRKSVGLIGTKDVICFDEITTPNIKISSEIVNMLKDTLNSGKFSRDTSEFNANANVCFIGNIECDRDAKALLYAEQYVFGGLPCELGQDRAFLDRITGLLPGWLISRVVPDNYSKNYGFMNDYFAAILHKLRDRNYTGYILSRIDFAGISHRNRMSLIRIISGLLKIMYPNVVDSSISKDELSVLLDYAIMLRKGVLDQLAILSPTEFGQENLQPVILE